MSEILLTLRYYWRTSLAVVLAAAATTAVLSGALVVGDSMRGSLRALALERLGSIDHALLSESFFREQLGSDLAADARFTERFLEPVPIVLLRGSANSPDSRRRAAGVQIQGINKQFSSLFENDVSVERGEDQRFASVVINQALASELSVEVGSDVVLSLARPSDVPRESLMGSTDVSDVVQSLRTTVSAVLPDEGMGRFGLDASQGVVLNAFVDLAVLQSSLDQPGRVNGLFVAARDLVTETTSNPDPQAVFSEVLDEVLLVEDFGLELSVVETRGLDDAVAEAAEVVAIESREIVLRPHIEEALLAWASESGVEALPITSYLANRTSVVGSDGEALPYSTITGLNLGQPAFGGMRWLMGSSHALKDDEIVINSWAASDLDVQVGDALKVEYWEVGDLEQLYPREVTLELSGVVAIEGLAADATLTPPFPGVHDADDMADWEPTFPVDLGLIRDRDEEYWDLYRATPKLFVAPELARRLWSSRFGSTSSIRFRATGTEGGSGGELAARLAGELPGLLDPALAGLAPLAVKRAALSGAKGATDFGGLFVGFSMFLIVSAAMLTALFFRLGVERRAREVGVRLGVGFAPKKVLKTFLREGLLLAGLGAGLGMVLAVVYARAMIMNLASRWSAALGLESNGAQFLELHVVPVTLLLGGLASFLIVAITIWRSVKRLEKLSVVSLLRGEVSDHSERAVLAKRARSKRVLVIAAPVTVMALVGSFFVDESQAAPLFFVAGAAFLVAGLALFARLLQREQPLISTSGVSGQLGMARANATLFAGRSLLATGLVAAAAFVIVAVGAYGHRFGDHVEDKASGAGGFVAMAHSDVPLYHDLGSDDGRFELGFSGADSELLSGREIFALREVPGDDVSCLNLYQPEKPRLLGVPSALIERGGFTFQQLAKEGKGLANPWELLQRDYGPDVVPAIGDFNSVMWILKSGVGKDVELENEYGRPIKVRIVGLLRKSLFQRELLIAEDQLLEHFPSRDGFQSFLFGPGGEGETDGLVDVVEGQLGRLGFDAVGSAEQLQAFQAVENTYLGTFRALGGLGLLLGTLGLSVVLLRNVLERTAELALLRAIGFKRRFLGGLVVAENALLLVCGLGLGTAAALLAVAPHLTSGVAAVPWSALALTLGVVLAVGLLASTMAARAAMNVVVLTGLRREG